MSTKTNKSPASFAASAVGCAAGDYAAAASALAKGGILAPNDPIISDFCVGDFDASSAFIRPASASYHIAAPAASADTPKSPAAPAAPAAAQSAAPAAPAASAAAMRWDFVRAHDAVSTFIYHADADAFVFVRQFRAPLAAYFGEVSRGFSTELCSGIIDRSESACQIAAAECAEELGLRLEPASLRAGGAFFHGFGSGCASTQLFFATARDADFARFCPSKCRRALAEKGYYIDAYAGGVDAGEHTQRVWVARGFFEQFFAATPRSALIEYAYLRFLSGF